MAGNSEARAVIVENEVQAAKIAEIRSALPHLEHVIGMEPGVGDLSLDDLRGAGVTATERELQARQSEVSAGGPIHDRLHVRDDRPAEGRCADPSQRDDRVRRRGEARTSSSRARSRICTCRSRTCSRCSRSSPPTTRAPRSCTSAATRSRSSPRSSRRSRRTSRPSRGSSRRSCGSDEAAGAGERRGSRALPAGGASSGSRCASVASAASRSRRSSRSRSSAPTRSCSSACATCSAARFARR